MKIETPRLILREMIAEDAEAFFAYNQHPEFAPYIQTTPNLDRTRQFVEKGMRFNAEVPRTRYYWTLLNRECNQPIGDISLMLDSRYPDHMASIGYGLSPDYWGKGYMSEALQAVTDFAHEGLKLHRVEITADADNIGSWRVMEKCGYSREGVKYYAMKTPLGWREETYVYSSVKKHLIPDQNSNA